ncbi:DsbA family protein [Sphingomonas sp. OTU376]|uniref:DsbA family protein n=1 Tax=Sphingomonas sp. OTU376 TaxID=3043863 RepID=UPI00313B2597
MIAKYRTGLILSVAVLVLAGSLYAETQKPAPAKPSDLRASDEGARLKSLLVNDTAMPSLAPQGYDVTIVVFSDYQCPYCRKLHPTLNQLLASDRKVRIVYRDWPIFGEASVEGARVAMAAGYQGKHAAFNDALMAGPVKFTSADIRKAAVRAGIDWQRLQIDLKQHQAEIDAGLGRTVQLARRMGLSGTPALVIGDYLIPGAIDAATLREAVKAVRQGAPK